MALGPRRSLGTEVSFGDHTLKVRDVETFDFAGFDMALFAMDAEDSRKFAHLATEQGCVVIDGSSAFRLEPSVPLVVPEVNPGAIEAVFSTPCEVAGEKLRLSATTGLLRLGDGPEKAVELLKNASVALKQAKSFTRGKALYFEAAHAASARYRMQLLNRLRLAFSAERLFLVYQPLVELASGRIVGAEALLRWRTEQGDFIPPDTFIPLAEQSGLMVPIGDWVARSALQFQRQLADLGHTGLRMAVNVSHVQFREPDFVDKLAGATREFGTPPGMLEIELTESVAIDNIELIEQKLAAVRNAGIAISIDDFGTGYSSLNIVRQLNVDRLKIDRSFISGKTSREDSFSIAGIVLQLATQLGLKTIAEGIETEEQRQRMLALGCTDGQGYLFARPLTSDEFLAFIAAHGNSS